MGKGFTGGPQSGGGEMVHRTDVAQLTEERRLSMRVSQTSWPPSSFVAQSKPPNPSAQMHTPWLWGQEKEVQRCPNHPPFPPGWSHPLVPGYKSQHQCGRCSSQDTEPFGSVGQPSPGDTDRAQRLQPHPGAHTPGAQGSSQDPLTHSGQSPLRR